MRAWVGLLIVAVSLGGCGSLPATERTPYLPPDVFGSYEDNDVGAINLASWAFASPANTRGNPVEAAKAVVALEYLTGELAENPRWIEVDASIPLHLGRARADLRQILGIRPDAPPQLVVNALLALSLDLQSGNQPAALQVLASPVFTLPPGQALQRLSNLPYVQEANLATARADAEMLSDAQGRF
jgi:hypothetical protein